MLVIISKDRFLTVLLPKADTNRKKYLLIKAFSRQIEYYSNLIDNFVLYEIKCDNLLFNMIDVIDNYRYFIKLLLDNMEVESSTITPS